MRSATPIRGGRNLLTGVISAAPLALKGGEFLSEESKGDELSNRLNGCNAGFPSPCPARQSAASLFRASS